MKKLRISPDLALPIETVTESIAILAKRGAGKTYAASVLVEEMLKAKLQVVVLDPMGAWWGLRSSADGKGPGFPIAIIGGDHGDVPLEPTGGKVVADLIVDEGLSTIVDLQAFSKNERRRFVAEFLERLYQRNRDALHVVLEEADLFAPEGKLKRGGDEQMLGAVYDLVRRGRGRGIGSTLITQRSASLSKEVLTQAEILLALRTTGPHDVAAVKEWIRYHGSDDERDVVLGSLHELPTGEAWAWWPVEGILKRIKIRERETFDSSATPKPGQTRREPKSIADVDLEALREQMAATIEKAKAEDPKELRKRLAELQRRAKERETAFAEVEAAAARAQAETKVERVEVPVLDGHVDQLQEVVGRLTAVAGDLKDAGTLLEGVGNGIVAAITKVESSGGSSAGRAPARRAGGAGSRPAPRSTTHSEGRGAAVPRPEPRGRPAAPAAPGTVSDFAPTGAQQRILDALAALEAIGIADAHKTQLALFAKASPKSSSYSNNLGALRTAGLVAYPGPSLVRLQPAGRAIADAGDAPSTTEELHRFVFELVGPAKARILEQLILYYDAPVEKVQLAELVGASATSSSFSNNLGSLRSLGLIDYPGPGLVAALPVLFLVEGRERAEVQA